ncbi:MAG: agmatinase [Armatimonadetes bacterium]|nr:agmatinase [Armatimonadota bacterium]MDW8122059.1 agmatinase [Armatimonadota bacterium]
MRFLAASGSDESPIVIVGAPYEAGSSFRAGASLGPSAIRRASHSIESYSHITRSDLTQIALSDIGDMALSDVPEEMLETVRQVVGQQWRQGKKVVLLGGDHSVTVGAVRALVENFSDPQVVILDAHSDWRDTYDGSPWSHACTARRIAELVNDRLFICGTRSFFGAEDQNFFLQPEELTKRVDKKRATYLSIDLDVLDPSLCPGVGNPEPAGLSYQDVLRLILGLSSLPIVGMDLVELHPLYDPSEVSAVVAAKLIQEAILAFWRQGRKTDEEVF